MRDSTYDFMKLVVGQIDLPEPIFEFGAFQIDGQQSIRHLFTGKNYVGCDFRLGTGVDRILDLHAIDLPGESVGSAVLLDTLEHVRKPSLAMAEVYRILKPDGVVVMSSCMYFHIHGYPDDYWRFTPSGFLALLDAFETKQAWSAGNRRMPHTVVAVGCKGKTVLRLDGVGAWERRHRYSMRTVACVNLPDWALNVARRLVPS